MKVTLRDYQDNWEKIKNATMTTIGKSTGKYPDSEWKRRLLLSEHSPIRKLRIGWKWEGLKYWVSVHLVRHKFGIEHFVTTQRSDRTGTSRDELPQGALVDHECDGNAQSIITVSRRRLCHGASPETREAWIRALDDVIAPVEPELRSVCVKDCVYRGWCYEMFSCGYHKTEAFRKELEEYRQSVNL